MDNQLKGSLYGLIWGDALGCPIETWKKSDIEKIYGVYDNLPEQYPVEKIRAYDERKASRLRPIGLHSDDGQQALGLVHVSLSYNTWNTEAWVNMLKIGLNTNAWRGIGGNFRNAVLNMTKRGIHFTKAGSSSAGIGAAMRVAPLGALYHDNLNELKRATIESTLVTHSDIRAASYAYAVTYTVAEFINGKSRDEIISSLPDAVKEVEDEMLTGYKQWGIDRTSGNLVSESIRTIFSKDIDNVNEIRKAISTIAKPHLQEGFTKAEVNQGFVLLGGLHALVMALNSSMEPNEILLSICREAYDTDTVAAIAGGILGARYGTDWIPTERLYDWARIEQYGNMMVSKQKPKDNIEAFVKAEKALTLAENQYQQELK